MDANSQLLRQAFDAAVEAARPQAWLAEPLRELGSSPGGLYVVALGKAAVPMAEVVARATTGGWKGLAVTPAGTARPVDGFTVLEASHPVPDGASLAAGEAALALAGQAGPQDTLLVLVSGGASALACAPIPGVTLAAKAEVTRRLLASDAAIGEINAVRRALSRLKGGGLARATGAGRVVTLAMSDVPGDGLADIGSGPGVPSPTGAAEAVAVLERFAPDLAAALTAPIADWSASLPPIRTRTEGRAAFPLDGGVRAAESTLALRGWPVEQLGVLTGDVPGAVERHRRRLGQGRRALVSGGELVVSVPREAPGRGGRNLHYLLTLAVELAGRTDVWALAADTDGIDGSSDAAGGWIDPELLRDLDVDAARTALAAFDAHGFLDQKRRLIRIGATGVNVGDLRVLLVA